MHISYSVGAFVLIVIERLIFQKEVYKHTLKINLHAHECNFHKTSNFVIIRYEPSNSSLFICPQEGTPPGKSGVPGVGDQHCLNTRVVFGESS